jgi:hypothetical protein
MMEGSLNEYVGGRPAVPGHFSDSFLRELRSSYASKTPFPVPSLRPGLPD